MQPFLDALTFIVVYGFSYGLILFMISIGLVVMMNLMRVVNMAHGLFAAVGGYGTATLISHHGVPFPLALAASVLAVTLISVPIERIFFVRLYGADELEQVLLTIGLMFIGIAGLNLVFGPDIVPARLPAYLETKIDVLGRSLQAYRLFVVLLGGGVILALWFLVERTAFGARLRAAVDNRSMAEATGIEVGRLFSWTFALGTGLAALGGGAGIAVLPLEPSYPFKYLVLILFVVSMSRVGSIQSAAVVAITLGLVDTAARYVNPDWGGFVLYLLVIVAMIWRGSPMGAPQQAPLVRHGSTLVTRNLRWTDLIYWGSAFAVFFIFPDDLSLASQIFFMSLFALSLNLVLGFGGIVTLGHSAFFGVGAYAAGLIAIAGWQEPITGALLAASAAGLVALCIGPIVLRLSGLPQIMVTLVFSIILLELGNKATFITGGDDGLRGIEIDPLLGLFRWSIYGQTAFFYALGWLLVMFLFIRQVIASPYGVALQGIRENPVRMRLIGTPVQKFLLFAYVLGGFAAGIAGAVSAQATRFVGLHSLSVEVSVDGLVMLVLGGVGRLYGALIGTPVYMLVRHIAAKSDPYNWMFIVGTLLVLVVLFARGGLLGLFDQLAKLMKRWLS